MPQTPIKAGSSPIEPRTGAAIVLLGASSLTVMSGAVIAPALPGIRDAFADSANIALGARLMLTLPALIIAVGALWVGGIARVLGQRRLLVAALVLYAVAGTTGLYVDSLALLLAGRVGLGAAVALILTITVDYVGQLFNGESRRRFLGRQGAAMSFGGVVFLTLGGAMADLGWRWPFALYGAALVVAVGVIWALPVTKAPTAPGTALANNPAAHVSLSPIYFTAAAAMVLFYLTPIQVPFLVATYGAGPIEAGTAIATATVAGGFAAMGFRIIRQRLGRYGCIASVFLSIAAGYLLVGIASSLTTVFLGLACAGLGSGLVMPLSNDWLLDRVDPATRATAAGRLTSSLFAGQFLSPLLFAPVITSKGPPAEFLIAAGVALLLGIWPLVVRSHATKK